MQTNYNAQGEHDSALDTETPVSFSHLVHTLRAYGGVIILSLIAVAAAFAIVAIAVYLRAPTQKTTSTAIVTEPINRRFILHLRLEIRKGYSRTLSTMEKRA